MRSLLRVAAASALFFSLSTAASAADYLTFRFNVLGTATRDIQTSATNTIHRSGELASTIEFVVPGTGPIGTFGYTSFLGADYAIDSYFGGVTPAGFKAAETTLAYIKGASRSFDINACGSFGGLSATVSVAVDPSCSSVSFFQLTPTGANWSGDVARFKGVVTGMTVTAGFGTPAAYGLINAPVMPVPEPASWAMMIAGVGLIGGALRYRRRSASLTYA